MQDVVGLYRRLRQLQGVFKAVKRDPKEVVTEAVWAVCQGSSIPAAVKEQGGAHLTGDFSALEEAIREVCKIAGVETREDLSSPEVWSELINTLQGGLEAYGNHH